jgi:CRISPR-associated protein Cas5d
LPRDCAGLVAAWILSNSGQSITSVSCTCNLRHLVVIRKLVYAESSSFDLGECAVSSGSTVGKLMTSPLVRVKVSGELACWTRPESKVERVTYECMTPSAARNILDAICWKPEMRWVIRRILVLKPIRFQSIRRMELRSRVSPITISKWMRHPSWFRPLLAGAGENTDGTLRNTLALRDVSYVIEAHPHVFAESAQDSPEKYAAMLNRRVRKGQCFTRPYLGLREFAATFEPPDDLDRPIDRSAPIGNMFYDIVFRDEGRANRALFFTAALDRGCLDADPARAIPDASIRKELLTCSYRR